MKKFLTVLLFPLASYAQTEAELACDLERAKAEVMAATVESPYIYGSVSNISNDRGATLGAGYSLAGRSRGKLMRESAAAKCSAIAATLQLDDQQKWILASIRKAGARTELTTLLEAKKQIEEHINSLKNQLTANTVTISDYNNAKQVQESIEDKINSLKMILTEPTQPVNIISIRGLIETAKYNVSRAAELDAKIQAESSWDITAVVGGRKNFGENPSPDSPNNKPGDPYVGIQFRWSFGADKAKDAVKVVREKTEQLFVKSQSGYVQTIDRLTQQITEANKIESERQSILQSQIQETQNWLNSIRNVNSAAAMNTRKSLEIQLSVQTAELNGIKRRLNEYQIFTSRL